MDKKQNSFSLFCCWTTISNLLPKVNNENKLSYLNKTFNTQYTIEEVNNMLKNILFFERESEKDNKLIKYEI